MSRIKYVLNTHGWLVVLCASLAVNVYLFAQPRTVSRASDAPSALIGSTFPQLTLQRWPDGSSTGPIQFPSGPKGSVIYFFSPKCIWCARNDPNFDALRSCAAKDYAVSAVTLTTDGMDGYLDGRTPGYPIFVDINREFFDAAGQVGTPTTIVVGADGRVTRVWRGAYLNSSAAEIEVQFGCKLPGLRDVPSGD